MLLINPAVPFMTPEEILSSVFKERSGGFSISSMFFSKSVFWERIEGAE